MCIYIQPMAQFGLVTGFLVQYLKGDFTILFRKSMKCLARAMVLDNF